MVAIDIAIKEGITGETFTSYGVDSQNLTGKIVHILNSNCPRIGKVIRRTISDTEIQKTIRPKFNVANGVRFTIGCYVVADVLVLDARAIRIIVLRARINLLRGRYDADPVNDALGRNGYGSSTVGVWATSVSPSAVSPSNDL